MARFPDKYVHLLMKLLRPAYIHVMNGSVITERFNPYARTSSSCIGLAYSILQSNTLNLAPTPEPASGLTMYVLVLATDR